LTRDCKKRGRIAQQFIVSQSHLLFILLHIDVEKDMKIKTNGFT